MEEYKTLKVRQLLPHLDSKQWVDILWEDRITFSGKAEEVPDGDLLDMWVELINPTKCGSMQVLEIYAYREV